LKLLFIHVLLNGKVYFNRMGDVMVNVFASNVIEYGLKSKTSQTKNYDIVITAFPLSMHLQDFLARNQDNVSDGNIMFTCVLFLQCAIAINKNYKRPDNGVGLV
jgi:hypothetical protein